MYLSNISSHKRSYLGLPLMWTRISGQRAFNGSFFELIILAEIHRPYEYAAQKAAFVRQIAAGNISLPLSLFLSFSLFLFLPRPCTRSNVLHRGAKSNTTEGLWAHKRQERGANARDPYLRQRKIPLHESWSSLMTSHARVGLVGTSTPRERGKESLSGRPWLRNWLSPTRGTKAIFTRPRRRALTSARRAVRRSAPRLGAYAPAA